MRTDAPRLEDRFVAPDGTVVLTGIQALVRATLDQRRLDARRGHDVRSYVSGYEGSPLGGLDREMARRGALLDEAGVVFRPGVNEELAATAVAGTQLAEQAPGHRHEGVTGYWYGKAPGLDRAADALRHGNVSGTSPLGGVVAWIGDDPTAKSSTVPSSSEPLCRSLFLPLLAPGTVAEALEATLHAAALSRHAGSWAGVRIVADVADAVATVPLDGLLDRIPELAVRAGHHAPMLLPPANLDAEHDLMTARMDRAREYARLAGLNAVAHEPPRPRVAVLAAGTAHQAVLRACEALGLDADGLDAAGVRLVRLGMAWPVDRGELRELLRGVETVLVVEDKAPFLEPLVRDALYRTPGAPEVLGELDAEGRPLLTSRAALSADDVALGLARVLGPQAPPRVAERVRAIEASRAPVAPAGGALPARTPYFCSGCPHNVSTRADAETLVGVGIGCHVMVALDGDGRRGELLGMTQMGGEGAHWLGIAPFTDDAHFVQNLGDGTFHHSGSLAIRAAVAAGADMTFRLLYNDAVAMTGGQHAEGRMAIPALTRWLALEGVRRVVVTTPEPGGYRGIALDPSASVRHRDDIDAVSAELAATPGVTVLLHDDRCATEERRLRKRGEVATPPERIAINERVCEGCGDCGEVSSCLSVQPVETEFGRKTRIHQASCAQDATCVKGDCPSFLEVTPAASRPRPVRDLARRLRRADGDDGAEVPARRSVPEPPAVPEPVRRVGASVLVRMPGVGGTGVVTVAQILQMAAHLDGRPAAGLDQIGLAQKGGPVVSDLRIGAPGDGPVAGQLRASAGEADVLLGFDLLGAAAPGTLEVCSPARTVAVVSTARTPTAAMVVDPAVRMPGVARPLRRVDAACRPGESLHLDAGAAAEALFGDHLQANVVLVGAAFQHGCLPLGAAAIERAIALNGAGAEANRAAFRWGRALAVDPAAVERATGGAPSAPRGGPAPVGAAAVDAFGDGDLVGAAGAAGRHADRVAALVRDAGLTGELAALVAHRAGELVAFQDVGCARAYVGDVARVAAAERDAVPRGARPAVALAYARHLHKLVAVKDEYEIARLHLDPAERARVAAAFGPGARVRIMMLPPMLRRFGRTRKVGVPFALAAPAFRALRALRRLRGTPLDPFARTEVRRVERALAGEYRDLVDRALGHLRPETVAQVVAIAELPDGVRGYEDVKLRSVAGYRRDAGAALAALASRAEAPAAVLPVALHVPHAA